MLITKIDRFNKWIEIVFNIQSVNNISGLIEGKCILGGKSITASQQHKKLRLIKSDLNVLSQEKGRIVDFFVENAKSSQHKIFLDRNGFFHCSFEDLMYYSEHYQWAIARESINGFYELVLVNGTDHESCKADIKWFVSSHSLPTF